MKIMRLDSATRIRAFVFAAVLIFSVSLLRADQAVAESPAEKHGRWLEEEVVYLIAPIEKEIFLKLKSDRERDLFIEAFWKQRDPTPGTDENEFKKEHYRRLSHVNRMFGRTTTKPGWMTDRGRMYIILGEPTDIQRYESKSDLFPAEVWFYQGKGDLGFPNGFSLVFFQEGGVGEYRLYSPLKDGPQALLAYDQGNPFDYSGAYLKLREIEPALASVSISFVPGEDSSGMGRPSLVSDMLVQNIEAYPEKIVDETYARKFFEYKDIVEVDYTANYIRSDSLVKVIKDASGVYFVHYAIEPERLSIEAGRGGFQANLKIFGSVRTPEGKNVFQFEKKISLAFDQDQIENINRRSYSIQDMFPLIPGEFKLSILLKNETSKEFTSLEQDLVIPGEDDRLQMTSLLLGYAAKKREAEADKLRPFQFGSVQVQFPGNRTFTRNDTLIAVFQVHEIHGDFKEKGEVRYVIMRDEDEMLRLSRKAGDYADLPDCFEEIPLGKFPPGHYRLLLSLAMEGREIISQREDFILTYLETIPRSWIHSRILPDADDPVYSYFIGTQLFNVGKIEAARNALEKAFRKKPDSYEYAINLAKACLRLADDRKIEEVLKPFLSLRTPPEYDVLFLLGTACKNMGKWDQAVDYFNQAVTHYGVNPNLLNVLGTCYFQMGDHREALRAWEKSLEINANQPQIQKNVNVLKEKK